MRNAWEQVFAYDPQAESTIKAREVRTKGGISELKMMVKQSVYEIKLAPEARQVKLTYRLPEPILITQLAGAVYQTFNELLKDLLVKEIEL
ncbi:MAG: hypothetical protein NTY09_01390 [bacterium]|nr:hypothetical protein [bacterium]